MVSTPGEECFLANFTHSTPRHGVIIIRLALTQSVYLLEFLSCQKCLCRVVSALFKFINCARVIKCNGPHTHFAYEHNEQGEKSCTYSKYRRYID